MFIKYNVFFIVVFNDLWIYVFVGKVCGSIDVSEKVDSWYVFFSIGGKSCYDIVVFINGYILYVNGF